jgi:hypothetical protein
MCLVAPRVGQASAEWSWSYSPPSLYQMGCSPLWQTNEPPRIPPARPPDDRALAAKPCGSGSILRGSSLPIGDCTIGGPRSQHAHPCRLPTSSRTGAIAPTLCLSRRSVFPSPYTPTDVVLASALFRCTFAPSQTIDRFAAFLRARLHQLSIMPIGYPWCRLIDGALYTRPKHGPLTCSLVWWYGRSSPSCLPMPGERLPCFFD